MFNSYLFKSLQLNYKNSTIFTIEDPKSMIRELYGDTFDAEVCNIVRSSIGIDKSTFDDITQKISTIINTRVKVE